jgi:hypothetical protein
MYPFYHSIPRPQELGCSCSAFFCQCNDKTDRATALGETFIRQLVAELGPDFSLDITRCINLALRNAKPKPCLFTG